MPRPDGDTAPAGDEAVLWRSADGTFVVGFWRRAPEEGAMAPPYHELAYVLEGDVDVVEADGTSHAVGPRHLLITPEGSRATWKSRTPVRKFWAIYKGR